MCVCPSRTQFKNKAKILKFQQNTPKNTYLPSPKMEPISKQLMKSKTFRGNAINRASLRVSNEEVTERESLNVIIIREE